MPLGIAKSDLPADLAPGERVDLYSIPKDAGAQTELVAVDIHIKNVDNRSRDLGGAVSVLFLLHEKEIMAVMDSLTSGRVVVVRHAL
jgi:regulator of RNase E activity RraA